MIYLASLYTHPDPAARETRFRAARRQAAEIFRCGIPVFSLIAYSHVIAAHDLPLEWGFWERFDRTYGLGDKGMQLASASRARSRRGDEVRS